MKPLLRYELTPTRKPKSQVSEDIYRKGYGKLNGYYRWDLAKDWLRMTNDNFFNKYGFNWIPPCWMYEQAREYL